MKTIGIAGLVLIIVGAVACGRTPESNIAEKPAQARVAGTAVSGGDTARVIKSDAEWKKILTPEQYHVLREKGTEAPFTNKYADWHEKGIYRCAGCGNELFSSETKFESGTGWPSFWAPIAPGRVAEQKDESFGMVRGEIVCARCGGHLGHVFDDGPEPTHLRYCMNSVALDFATLP